MSGSQVGSAVSGSIPYRAPFVLYNPPQIPDGFLGSVRIVSTNNPPKPLVGEMSETNSNGFQLISNLALAGTTTVHVPIWYDNYTANGSNWLSGVNVRNTGSGSNHVKITWHRQNGTVAATQTATLTGSNDTHNFYDPLTLNNFIGSAVIQSTSNKPVVAVSNIRNYGGTSGKDQVMAINGSNR